MRNTGVITFVIVRMILTVILIVFLVSLWEEVL